VKNLREAEQKAKALYEKPEFLSASWRRGKVVNGSP
jgi:hypothetical protein